MPKIVSVYSFRHGTGKSNLIANLAASIARLDHRVGIIDTDTRSPGIQALFGLNDANLDHALNHYLWGDVPLEEVDYTLSPLIKIDHGEVVVLGGEIYLTPYSIRLKEIPALLRQGYDAEALTQSFLGLSDKLKLDYLFIDTHPGLGEETLLSIALSDILIVVLCLDQQDFQGSAVMIDLARRLGVSQILLVANQVLPQFEQDPLRQQLEDTYGESVAGILPFAEEMLVLASSDIFCRCYPDHPLTHGIEAIAYQLLKEPEREGPPFLWLQSHAAPVDTQSGLRMLDLPILPDAERQVLNWIIRQGRVTCSQVADYTGQDEETVQHILGILAKQGFLQTSDETGELQYCIRLVSGRGSSGGARGASRRLSESFWQFLER